MKVEIVRCEDSGLEGEDGAADAVARAVLAQAGDAVIEDYVGFPDESLDEILEMMARTLEDGYGVRGLRVPPAGVPLGDDPAPEAIRAFLADADCQAAKVVVFHGGEDDAEENGCCAAMVDARFDVGAALGRAGIQARLDSADPDGFAPRPGF